MRFGSKLLCRLLSLLSALVITLAAPRVNAQELWVNPALWTLPEGTFIHFIEYNGRVYFADPRYVTELFGGDPRFIPRGLHWRMGVLTFAGNNPTEGALANGLERAEEALSRGELRAGGFTVTRVNAGRVVNVAGGNSFQSGSINATYGPPKRGSELPPRDQLDVIRSIGNTVKNAVLRRLLSAEEARAAGFLENPEKPGSLQMRAQKHPEWHARFDEAIRMINQNVLAEEAAAAKQAAMQSSAHPIPWARSRGWTVGVGRVPSTPALRMMGLAGKVERVAPWAMIAGFLGPVLWERYGWRPKCPSLSPPVYLPGDADYIDNFKRWFGTTPYGPGSSGSGSFGAIPQVRPSPVAQAILAKIRKDKENLARSRALGNPPAARPGDPGWVPF